MEPLFKDREIEVNHTVLSREDHPSKNDCAFQHKTLEGMFFRVIPSTAREVFFIQGLAKNYIVFTPENGNGLIISPSCLKGMKQ